MKYLKENIIDIIILVLLTLWGLYEIFMMPIFHDSIVTIFICCCLISLFPWVYKKRKIINMKKKYAALQFAFAFFIVMLCLLKVAEILFEKTMEIEGIKIIFIGIYVQSIYYILKKKKYQIVIQEQ